MVSKKLEPNAKIKLMQHWYRWFHDHAENWSELGMEVAFLLGAILNDGHIHVDARSKLREKLIEKNISENDPIWGYIHFYDKFN
jgi:hypothetical protein